MQICFFGSYDKFYSRNQILLKGLALANVGVTEVHLPLPKSNIDHPDHMGMGILIKRILRKLKLISLIFRNLKQIRETDIILSAFPTHLDMPFSYIVSRIFGKPLVFDPLWAFSTSFVAEFGLLPKNSLRARVLRLVDRMGFWLADYIIFDTSVSRDYYQKDFNIPPQKLKVVHIGADDSVYKYSGIDPNKTKFSVIYYGLYNPMHGVEHIIECANLCRENPDIEFFMIGKGQTYDVNRKRADELKLPNLIFLPDVTEKDAKKYLDQGDAFLGFLNTSISADIAIPNKVFQGLALGKAVVTAKTPVTSDNFKHKENIYLCKLSDPKSLYEAIMELKDDRALTKKIADNGYELFKQKFTPEVIGNEFKSICEELILERSNR